MLILPDISPEPLEFWHPWNVGRAARVFTCRTLHFNGMKRGVRWEAPHPSACWNMLCDKECAHRRVALLMVHLFKVLVPEPWVWVTYQHVTSGEQENFRKYVGQRTRRATQHRKKDGEPPAEYGLFSTWHGWKMVMATADLTGRSPRWGGSWLSGVQAYDLLRRSAGRVGVLDRWPSFSKGGSWSLPARVEAEDGAESRLQYLGYFTPEDAEKRFQRAADGAEQRWGRRPADGEPLPRGIPVEEWETLMLEAYGRS